MPFNIYDFFGYIFPGAYTGLMILLVSSKSNSRLGFLIDKANNIVYRSDSLLSSILSATLLIIVAYALGHIVATISHIAIDRLLVNSVLGYPMDRLLQNEMESSAQRAKRSTGSYIFLSLLLMLIGPVWFYHFGISSSLNEMSFDQFQGVCHPRYYVLLGWLLLLLLVIRGGHAFLSSPQWSKFSSSMFANTCWNCVINIYSAPARWLFLPLLHMVESFIGTDRRVAPDLAKGFQAKFKERFDLDATKIRTESYWLAFFHLNRRDGSAIPLLANWLHIYSFARNMAAACFALLLYILYRLHTMKTGDREVLLVTYVLNFYLMLFFLLRYWMIYYTYFTKSIVRLFFTSVSDSQHK